MLAISPKARIEIDIAETWQARALRAAQGRTAMVLLSVLAHNYDDAMLPLLQVTFPGFVSITAPFLCSAGRIQKTGAVTADLVTVTGRVAKSRVFYKNEIELRDDFRRLADGLKLCDSEREQLFVCVQRWVVADRRLDPLMNPRDPDAKRLVN